MDGFAGKLEAAVCAVVGTAIVLPHLKEGVRQRLGRFIPAASLLTASSFALASTSTVTSSPGQNSGKSRMLM
jgi:hypothetical protein